MLGLWHCHWHDSTVTVLQTHSLLAPSTRALLNHTVWSAAAGQAWVVAVEGVILEGTEGIPL